MTRLDMRVNRITKACGDVGLDMALLTVTLDRLSDAQIQNLAQKCYLTQKELCESEKAFDREFNRRVRARLAKGT